jgi:hypothetical protein
MPIGAAPAAVSTYHDVPASPSIALPVAPVARARP